MLVVDGFDCESISGSVSQDSPTVKALAGVYSAAGLITTVSGTWEVELQSLPPGSYGTCRQAEVAAAASLVIARLQEEAVQFAADYLGWTRRSQLEPDADAGTFSNPGYDNLMRHVRKSLRGIQGLAQQLGEGCENDLIGELISDISVDLYRRSQARGDPPLDQLREAGYVMIESEVWVAALSDAVSAFDDFIDD